jgi:hypothetical protein
MASASALGVLARLILQYSNVEYVKPKPNSTNYERVKPPVVNLELLGEVRLRSNAVVV